MSGPLRAPASPLRPGELVLDEALGRYLAKVHRLRQGDRLVLFDPELRVEADAELLNQDARQLRCLVSELRSASRVTPFELTLLQAVGKADKFDQVVRDATQLGASRVIAVVSERSVVRLDEQRGPNRLKRWHKIAVESARQCGRGDAPLVVGPCTLDEALALVEGNALGVCLVPGAETTLAEHLSDWAPERAAALLIGPEGGLSEAEVARAVARGFAAASLGPFVLRTETAAITALAAFTTRLTQGLGSG